MKSVQTYRIIQNVMLTKNVYKMILEGDTSWVEKPGQFINITVDNGYLKRPISISDWNDTTLTIIYKIVGDGTEWMSHQQPQQILEVLVGLGNGFDLVSSKKALIVGGGVGVPPLYRLCKELIKQGTQVEVILGFNTLNESFYEEEFKQLGANVTVCTVDGSYGVKGYVSNAIQGELKDYPYYSCGPLPMLKAVFDSSNTQGQLSFEERMGCGFGACMGCSCKTLTGYKRICVEGPVMKSEEILWTKD
ncbi:dihydroorotate dehydrogenase electron transfer subunit [Anaerorhabdus sp.]|uniref:dihydroorotate dehydrogenase electron transfer subunit n=1 Tax=Anaerorhabdus sp. TaxID=1872524 RepID=UPI002FCB070A